MALFFFWCSLSGAILGLLLPWTTQWSAFRALLSLAASFVGWLFWLRQQSLAFYLLLLFNHGLWLIVCWVLPCVIQRRHYSPCSLYLLDNSLKESIGGIWWWQRFVTFGGGLPGP